MIFWNSRDTQEDKALWSEGSDEMVETMKSRGL
jgi:hypothetical protein